MRRYLAESARVLTPGGRLAFTVFALDPDRQRSEVFDFQAFDETSLIIDARHPERAIGHWRTALEAAVTEAGLTVAGKWNGAWSPPAAYEGGQDLYVVVKAV